MEVTVLKLDGTWEPVIIAPTDEEAICHDFVIEKRLFLGPPDMIDVLCDGVSVAGKPIKRFNGKILVIQLRRPGAC